MKNMQQILESIGSDILSEDVKKSIVEAFNASVEKATNDRVEASLKVALEKVDNEHFEKVQKLIEAQDDAHTNLFKQVVRKIDESHSKKLQQVVEKYQKEIGENAESFKKQLVEKVSKFLDIKLGDMVPKDHLKEAVQNIKARKLVDEIKRVLSFDPEAINDEVKSALKEGYDTIESLRKELNDKAKENLVLTEKINRAEASVLLESKIKDLPEAKRKFITKVMDGKGVQYINENLDYVMKMFENEEQERAELLRESASKKSESSKVAPPKSQIRDTVVTESATQNDDEVSKLVGLMEATDNFYRG